MLYCKECDYFSAKNDREVASLCDFSGFAFSGDVENMEMNYPCGEISYAQYLKRGVNKAAYGVLHRDEWRLIYKRNHAKRAA